MALDCLGVHIKLVLKLALRTQTLQIDKIRFLKKVTRKRASLLHATVVAFYTSVLFLFRHHGLRPRDIKVQTTKYLYLNSSSACTKFGPHPGKRLISACVTLVGWRRPRG